MAKSTWETITGVALLFLLYGTCAAQEPFDCNGRMYRVLEEQGGTTFQEILIDLETQEAEFVDLTFYNNIRINGIAYRPADNLIYGILLETPYVLCRIDANYQLERLAELPLPENMLFVSGDVSPDERYHVLLGYSPDESGNLLALVDLESPTFQTQVIPASKTNPDADVYCADIAFHPTLDQLFGFEHSERRLITIDLQSGQIDNTSYPTTDVIDGNVPTIFFDAFGNLFGVGSAQGVFSNRNLYLMDTETGAAEIFENMIFERNQDGCSCPFKVELLNRVSSRQAYPCTILDFEFTILNRTDREQINVQLTDTFPEGSIISAISDLPFEGNLVSGVGSNVLDIKNITLPIGQYEFTLSIEIPEGTPPQDVFNRAYLDNVFLTSLIQTERIFSDDPETAKPDDPTFFSIDALAVTFNGINSILCPGETLYINTGVSGASAYQWSTGATTNQIEVISPGSYAATVTSACEEATGTIEVQRGDISLNLGPDITIENGELIDLNPIIFSDVAIQSYFWEESPGTSLSCLTCPTPNIQPTEDSEYQLTIENLWGCQAQDLLQVTVTGFRVFAPNAFSPNGDNRNDRFFLQSKFDYPIPYFRIFDRWGNLVFEKQNIISNDPTVGWNGKLNGKPLGPGVFVWLAEVQAIDGTVQVISGDVVLVR